MTGRYGLDRLRAAAVNADTHVADVSRWSIGMHVHHCCLAMIAICRSLQASTPPPPRSRFSPITTIIFVTGWIPRGRGRAPEFVIPQQGISSVELGAVLKQSERSLANARDLDPETWFKHFVFGVLARDRALRFIEIHNRHHLRIISDIAAAQRRT